MSPGNGTRWVGKSFPSRGSSRHNTRLSSKRRNGLWERPLRKEHRTGEQVHRDLRHRPPDETRRHHAPAPPSGKPGSHGKESPTDPLQEGGRTWSPAGGRSSDGARRGTAGPRTGSPEQSPGSTPRHVLQRDRSRRPRKTGAATPQQHGTRRPRRGNSTVPPAGSGHREVRGIGREDHTLGRATQ